jgi:hypothetical protein
LYKDKKKLFSRGGGKRCKKERSHRLQIKRKLEINAADARILRQLKEVRIAYKIIYNFLEFIFKAGDCNLLPFNSIIHYSLPPYLSATNLRSAMMG